MKGCKFNKKHYLVLCNEFCHLDADQKGQIVLDKKLCILCLREGHQVKDCPKKKEWKPCDNMGCGKWHSRMVHGANVPGLTLTAVIRKQTEAADVVLLVQDVQVEGNGFCTTFWDNGSTINLIMLGGRELLF